MLQLIKILIPSCYMHSVARFVYKRLNFFIYTAYSMQVKRSQPLNSSRRGLYLCSSADQNPRTINENVVNSVDIIDFMSHT